MHTNFGLFLCMKAFLSACSRFKLSNTFAVYMCDSEENRDMPLVFLASSRVQSAATQPDNAAFPLIMFVGNIGDCSRGSRCYVSVCATIDYDDAFDDDDDDDDYTVNICIYLSICLSIYICIYSCTHTHTHVCVCVFTQARGTCTRHMGKHAHLTLPKGPRYCYGEYLPKS